MKQTYILALFLGTISAVRFASGASGDEDLGEDITMKGKPFHYLQGAPTAVAPEAKTGAQSSAQAATAVKSPCNPGEIVGPDGNCYFEGEAVQLRRQQMAQTDPISSTNYDPWVYETSKDNMGNFPAWHTQ